MRIPVPNNRLVALTLAGALLTTVVAGGLAFPGLVSDPSGDAAEAGTDAVQQVADGAPEPNEDFTPAVQSESGYEEHEEHEDDEYEEHEEHKDDEYEEHEEHEDDEYEEHEEHEDDEYEEEHEDDEYED